MFYSGWELPAPTFMNIGALSEELRHANTSGDAAAAYLTQDILLGNVDDNHLESATQQRQYHQLSAGAGAQSSASRVDGSDAVQYTPSGPSEAIQVHPSPLPSLAHRRRPFGDPVKGAGCVLHLAARTALSFKEMEQLLHRRTTGSSDCFHVKSNAPAMSRAAVVFMECVVVGPSVQPAADTAGTADGSTHRDTAAASPTASAGKPTLPALVLGVCQRFLKWYGLPGEAENSIGFYVAQRLIVKNGNEDGDAVKLPDDGRSGIGGSRVNYGDHVGCLIDLVRHQLVFTVNKDIVSTLPLEPSLADGSYYFAIGLARLPQQATDVVVRFYSGAQCMSQGKSYGRSESSPHQQQGQQPVFPLEKYVRELALQWVERCTTFLSGQEGESHIRQTITTSSSGQRPDGGSAPEASHNTTKAEHQTAESTNALCGSRIPLASEALRDTRVTAILRDYLSVRGMASTLQALDAELQELSPAQSCVYVAPAHAASGDSAESSSPPPSPQPASSRPSHVLWRPPMRGEAQEAWKRYAAGMSLLRKALLEGAAPDASGAPPPPPLSALLGQVTLWRPSLAYAFASMFESHVAAASGEVGIGGEPSKSGSGAQVPLSPYDWVGRTIHPSLFTLSMLALRQDTRYLVQSYQAVEELWGILQSYLSAARAACQRIRGDHYGHRPQQHQGSSFASGREETSPTASAVTGRNSKPSFTNDTASSGVAGGKCFGRHSLNPSHASFAPTPEAERQVQAAFTSFFTQLVWNPARVLPSPMTHIRRPPSLSGGVGTAVPASSGEALGAASLEALATLAGRTGARSLRHSKKTHPASYRNPSCRPLDADKDAEDFRACAAACAASARRGTSTPGNDSGNGSQGRNQQSPSPQPHPHQRRLYAAHVEEAILVLYRAAVVPAPAPSRSSQVCLLQTLSSLHTHTVSTLRQMERFLWSDGSSGGGGAVGFANRTVLDSIDLLDTLLRTVQNRYRQQVWRRLVHTVEDVNQQLEEQLRRWSVLAQKPQRTRYTPFASSTVQALPLVKEGHLQRSVRPSRQFKSESNAKGGSCTRGDTAAAEDDGATRQRSSVKGQTSTLSLLKGEMPTHGALEGEGEQAMPLIPSYEDLTAFMPSLRMLWRRVAARAALEPSLHLVTELFVQELRRSLSLAPSLGWHQRAFTAPCTASNTGSSSSPAVSTEAVPKPAAAVRATPSVVTVKRPLSVVSSHRSGSSDTPKTVPRITPRLSGKCEGEEGNADEVSEAAARWFAEELYLSSMYMKRVFKHMSGS
ncbi:hypothetical protein JKF63_05669 [Porcisia hertigi]|uniref:Uncharacterized protein n=1 Tax=Porcisia hertigi TaxID=2761500 RepID=A0A836I5Z5_9TRYP|nr:hypothetical protein JKF63_05669 [Porcisia hertigi]